MEERDDLVTLKTAILAKEKGFDRLVTHGFQTEDEKSAYVKCYEDKHCYNVRGQISRPTQSELQKWLREVKLINVESCWLPNIKQYGHVVSDMTITPKDYKTFKEFMKANKDVIDKSRFDKYEDALEDALHKALNKTN